MSQPVIRPVFLESDGVFGRLPSGAIIPIGGTETADGTFTVNGRGVLFDDGTSTAPGGAGNLSLQKIYDLSPAISGEAVIKLALGKDFVIKDDTDNSLFFKVDAETGKVTITGDLEVLGDSTIIDTVVQDSDHWQISPKNGGTTALRIEPDVGVTPYVDLVTVRRTFGSYPVLRIDSTGNLLLTQNIIIDGTVDGVDISNFKAEFDAHLSGAAGYRHQAVDVDIMPIFTIPGATNVQEALEMINTKADLAGGGGAGGTVTGFEHVQLTPAVTWTVNHALASPRAQVTIYDSNWEQILPENVKILDANTILISFNTAIAGRAMVLAF